MPFKMMNPLKKMDTTAMKTVQKSAMKLKDLNNDGETTKADLLIKKGVYNKDGSPKKKASGVNYMNESKSPAKVTGFGAVGAVIKDELDKNQGKGKYLSKAGLSKYEINLLKGGISKGASKGLKESYNKAKAKQDAYNKKMPETGATSGKTGEAVVTAGSGSRTEVEKKQTVTVKEGTEANKLMNKIMEDSQAKKAESSSGKLPTYKQAWEKLSDAAKKKYGTQAEFTKQAKAYNNRGKTEATIPKEKETVTTETVTNANDISGNTGRNNAAADVLKRAKESAENKKKEEEAKKKAAAAAAAEEAKKNKKLTPKEKRKAERNIKAQEKANKKIRKGGGTEIEVDKKNTTATAADRRKLKQGAKRLEQKLSLAQKEIDRKNKKKKEDKNGKDKKEKDNTSKTSKSLI
jgi:hypothetical protein